MALLAHLPAPMSRALLSTAGLLRQVAPADVGPLAAALQGLSGTRSRTAFVRTARAVIDWRGQTVSALRHLRLLTDLPVLVVWGDADRTIPPAHHRDVARQLPHARSAELADAGHYPQETAPDRLLPPLLSFLVGTRSVAYRESRWRDLLTAPPSGAGPTPPAEPARRPLTTARR